MIQYLLSHFESNSPQNSSLSPAKITVWIWLICFFWAVSNYMCSKQWCVVINQQNWWPACFLWFGSLILTKTASKNGAAYVTIGSKLSKLVASFCYERSGNRSSRGAASVRSTMLKTSIAGFEPKPAWCSRRNIAMTREMANALIFRIKTIKRWMMNKKMMMMMMMMMRRRRRIDDDEIWWKSV